MDFLWIKTVIKGQFLTLCDVVKRIKNNPPIVFSDRTDIGCRRMIDETRFIASKYAINAVTITELHQAGEPDRIVELLAALHFLD